MIIHGRVFCKSTPYPFDIGCTFMKVLQYSDLPSADIILLNHYSIPTMTDLELKSLLDSEKLFFIDSTFELVEERVIRRFLNFNDLQKVIYFCIPRTDQYYNELMYEARHRGMTILFSQYFADYDSYFQPIINNAIDNKKEFLLYTGKTQPERTALVALLSYYELLQYGYVSFFGENNIVENFGSKKIEQVYEEIPMNDTERFQISEGLKRLQLPLALDVTTFGPTISHSKTFCRDYYDAVDFVIVTETWGAFYEDVLFITEKTAKCIILNKKFIVLSGYGYVEKLKNYYKTVLGKDISHLTDWCDTSYDQEKNLLRRIQKIVQIVSDNIKYLKRK